MSMDQALVAGSTGLGGFLSYDAAEEENAALSRAARSARQAATIEQRQLAARAGAERAQIRSRINAIRGRLRVTGATQGGGFGETFLQLEQQSDFDEAMNRRVIETNYASNVARVRSGLAARLDELRYKARNPLLDALMGGLQGAHTGLSLAAGYEEFTEDEEEGGDDNGGGDE